MPPMTLPNIMPTRGTIITSLNFTLWINQTKIQVPKIAKIKAKMALDQIVELGMKRSASRMPNWEDEMVAPVVGDINLFIQSCCMIKPAILIPTPVHKIAKRRGSLEIKKISNCSPSLKREVKFISRTPTNKETTDRITSRTASVTVIAQPLIALLLRQP